MFNPELILWTHFRRIGPVEKGPGGLMADYELKGKYGDLVVPFVTKVLHSVENPEEPDELMYDLAYDVGTQTILKNLRIQYDRVERDKLGKELADRPVDPEAIQMADIKWSEPFEQGDVVNLTGTLMEQTLAASSNREHFDKASMQGHRDTMINDMKLSILQAVRESYRRINLQVNPN